MNPATLVLQENLRTGGENVLGAAEDVLRRLGFLKEADLGSAIVEFRTACRLPATDELDENTRTGLADAFCSVWDRRRLPTGVQVVPAPSDAPIVKYAFAADSPEVAAPPIRRALGTWSREGMLQFEEVKDEQAAQMLFMWVSDDPILANSVVHARIDPVIPFKKLVPKGAEDPKQVRVLFDRGELWAVLGGREDGSEDVDVTERRNGYEGRGLDVESVAVHEIGHVLGLNHCGAPQSVMGGFMGAGVIRRALTPADVQALQSRFGPRNDKQRGRRENPSSGPAPTGHFVDPDQFCSVLQPGDVLLFEGLDPFATLLQWLDGSAFNHAALWVGAAENLPDALRAEVEALGEEDGFWTIHAGLSPLWPFARKHVDHGAIQVVHFDDLVNQPSIGLVGGETRTVLARRRRGDDGKQYLGPEQAKAVLAQAAAIAQANPPFDYANLSKLSTAWVTRAHKSSTPRVRSLMEGGWKKMLPSFRKEARQFPASIAKDPRLTTCSRFVFDSYDIDQDQDLALEPPADRDLSFSSELDPKLRPIRQWITPGDLQWSPSLLGVATLMVHV